jgi:hypothetical protein
MEAKLNGHAGGYLKKNTGFAANIDKGAIAVSKDGDWDGVGVVFQDASIKKGAHPCFSTSDYQLRYCFNQDGFKYCPQTDSVWDVSG